MPKKIISADSGDSMEILKIKKLREDAKVPNRATSGSAGLDLCACIDEPITLKKGDKAIIPTGIAIGLDDPHYAAFIYARSGLACKRGLAPANKVGVVDCDYRGEVTVALHNHSSEPQTVAVGERVAQMVIAPYYTADFELCDELSDTVRGEGGFGSTGRK